MILRIDPGLIAFGQVLQDGRAEGFDDQSPILGQFGKILRDGGGFAGHGGFVPHRLAAEFGTTMDSMASRLKRMAKTGMVAFGVLIAGASLGLVGVLQFWPSDRYRFLGGRDPVLAGVMPPIQICFANPPHERWAQEYRIYSWKQDFASVVAAAERELPAFGFMRVPARSAKEDWVAFEGDEGKSVWLQPGPSETRREALGGKGSRDPKWVTVVIETAAPRNWVTHVRIAFEPTDW